MQSTNFYLLLSRVRIHILCGVGALLLNSCKSFIEVDLPGNMLTNELVFQDVATADAALIALYGKLRGEFPGTMNSITGTTMYSGLSADELDAHQSFAEGNPGQFYHNNLVPDNTMLASIWSDGFQVIYAANSILEGVEQASDQLIKLEDKQRVKGEALFIRAFVNLYMTQLFGDIPWVTTTDYQLNKHVSRTLANQILSNLVEDLKVSVEHLSENYSSAERIRPNASVARALLARVYLYQGDWKSAEQTSEQLIDNQFFRLRSSEDIGQVFLKNSPETIWQFAHQEANYPTSEAAFFHFTTAPPNSVSLTEHLIQTFSDQDQRKRLWILPVVSPQGATFYYLSKYKNRSYGGNTTEMSIQFRLAEQYLIRAESRIQQGKLEEGRSDLNRTRERAGLAPLLTIDREQLMNELLAERFRELFLEYPHRLFDVIRMERTEVFKAQKPGWSEKSKLFPIPMKEMELNPHLRPQNPGYE